MNPQLSSNCHNESDDAKVMFMYTATDSNNVKNSFQGFMLSCQDQDFAHPDDRTTAAIKGKAAKELMLAPDRINVFTNSVRLNAQSTEGLADILMDKKMASNCGPTYDLSDINSNNQYVCHYFGEGKDGRRNFDMTWKGTLASCERGDSDEGISKQTIEDIKNIVYRRAEGKENGMDLKHFSCKVVGLPQI